MCDRNTRVVVVPSILAIGFLGQSTGYLHSLPADFNKLSQASWIVGYIELFSSLFHAFIMTGLVISMVVNAMVTVMIVFKILGMFWKIKTTGSTVDDRILGVPRGSTLQHIIFILIESGMALFFIQVFGIVVTIVNTDAANNAYPVIVCIHSVLNVNIKSVIANFFFY